MQLEGLLLARLLRCEAQAIFSLNLGQRIYKKKGRNWSPDDPVGRMFSSKREDLWNLSKGGWTDGRAALVSHPGTPVGRWKAETGGISGNHGSPSLCFAAVSNKRCCLKDNGS